MRRGLVATRQQAQAAIEAGTVLVGGAIADKPARLVAASDPVEISGPRPRFVSRGGDKLDAALEEFAIVVEGRRVLDAGASTGGFTDCLLQWGAGLVYAVDVGHGQLDARLRAHERVVVRERLNVRELTLDHVDGQPVDVVVADLSFISLRTVLPVLAGPVAAPGADLVLLVKPQFEAGRVEAARGRGVIKDPEIHRRVLEEVSSAIRAEGATKMGEMESPLAGAEGNTEFLVHARAHTG